MKNLPAEHGAYRQPLGFLWAGGISTATHWAVMAILIMLTLEPVIATACGSVTGGALNFVLQKRFAFHSANNSSHTMLRYVLSCIFAWLANIVFFSTLSSCFIVSIPTAQVITTLLVAYLNFHIYKRMVFI